MIPTARPLQSIAVVGAGPAGLALALLAARRLPGTRICLFDARPLEKDVAADPRTLALSHGSVQLLQRLDAWPAERAQAILEVHVSQQAASLGMLAGFLGEPLVRISAADEGVPQLGAVLGYGDVVASLQKVWLEAAGREPRRLSTRFGTPVQALKPVAGGAEIDAGGVAETFDLVVVAEGGVFGDKSRLVETEPARPALRHDYGQTAWVGTVLCARPQPGVAYERFTRQGPAALLPLQGGRAALIWCVDAEDDPVAGLDDDQRLAVLNTIFHPDVGALTSVSSLKHFPLGLSAERSLSQGRIVRIGNAAQTLHPVAGQGLNLGLRDAYELVQSLARPGDVDAVLQRLEWQRGPDRWAMIFATDFLARSFVWKMPGAGVARGLGMAALQLMKPVKSALARQMMYGSR